MLKKYQFAYMDASLNEITNQKPKSYGIKTYGITNNTKIMDVKLLFSTQHNDDYSKMAVSLPSTFGTNFVSENHEP